MPEIVTLVLYSYSSIILVPIHNYGAGCFCSLVDSFIIALLVSKSSWWQLLLIPVKLRWAHLFSNECGHIYLVMNVLSYFWSPDLTSAGIRFFAVLSMLPCCMSYFYLTFTICCRCERYKMCDQLWFPIKPRGLRPQDRPNRSCWCKGNCIHILYSWECETCQRSYKDTPRSRADCHPCIVCFSLV